MHYQTNNYSNTCTLVYINVFNGISLMGHHALDGQSRLVIRVHTLLSMLYINVLKVQPIHNHRQGSWDIYLTSQKCYSLKKNLLRHPTLSCSLGEFI
jgi:hypothetical protein